MAAPMTMALMTLMQSQTTPPLFDNSPRYEPLTRPTEDMTHKTTVTVSYEEYHDLKSKLEVLEQLARDNSIILRTPNSYSWKEYAMVTPRKAMKQIEEKYNQLFSEHRDMQRVIKAHEGYIDYLENRGLISRIINKIQ